MAVRIAKPAVNIREKLAELERPIGLNGSALLRTETPQEAFEILQCGRRNMIINGDMRIAQRGTSLSGLTATGVYLIDRIPFYVNAAGTWTYTQSSNAPPGFKYSARFQCTTANASLSSTSYLIPEYTWEGNDLQRLGWGTSAAKPLTLSFWCRSNKPGIYHTEIQIEGSKEISRRYTINQANVWEYKTMTFDANTQFSISATNEYGGNIYFWLAAGSAYNSGTSLNTVWGDGSGSRASGNVNLADAVGNYFEITGIQAEIGKVATPFEYRSIGEELALCKRYYEFGYFNPTTFADQYGNATWQGFFNVEKRSTGTLSYDDGQGNTSRIARWFTSSYATNVQPTGLSVDNVRGFSGYIGSLSAGTLVKVGFHWQQNSEL